jgi:hypothetical protein
VLRNAFAIVCWLNHIRFDCTISAASHAFFVLRRNYSVYTWVSSNPH